MWIKGKEREWVRSEREEERFYVRPKMRKREKEKERNLSREKR